MADLTLTLKLSGKDDLSGKVKKASGSVSTLKKRLGGITGAASKSRSAISRLGTQSANTSNQIRSMGGIAKGVIATLAGFLGLRGIISTAREFGVLRSSLETVTGSAQLAQVQFNAIQAFAADTPNSVEQTTQAFLRLKSMGLDSTMSSLESYGNTASAMGKDLMQMTEAVADAATGEFERLKEFGIKAKVQGDNVSFIFKGVTTTVKNNSAEIQQYLLDIGNTDFAGAMDKRAQTVDGILSNMGDSFDRLKDSIGKGGLNDAIKAIGPAISGAMDSMSEFFASGAFIETLKQQWELFANAIGMTGDDLSSWTGSAWEVVRTFFGNAFQLIADLPVNVQIATAKAAAFVDQGVATMGYAWDDLGLRGRAMWSSIADVTESVWQSIKLSTAQAIDWIVNQFGAMLGKLEGVGAAIDFLPGIDGVESRINSAAESLINYTGAERAVRAEISQTAQAHVEREAAFLEEKIQLDAAYEARIAGSNAAVRAAEEEGQAALDNRDMQIALTRELYNAEQAELALEASALDAANAMQEHGDEAGKTASELKTEAAEARKAAREAENLARKEASAARAHELHRGEVTLLIDRLSDQVDVMGVLQNETDDLIARAFDLGLSEEQLAGMLNETTQASLRKAEGMANDALKAEESATLVATAWEEGMKRVDNSFAQAFRNGFKDMKSFTSNIKNAFKDMLAEIAYQWAKSGISRMFSSLGGGGGFDLGSLLGGGTAGTGFNPFGSIASSVVGYGSNYLASLLGGAGGQQAAMLASQTGVFGTSGAAMTNSALGGTSTAGISSIAAITAPIALAAAGVWLGNNSNRGEFERNGETGYTLGYVQSFGKLENESGTPGTNITLAPDWSAVFSGVQGVNSFGTTSDGGLFHGDRDSVEFEQMDAGLARSINTSLKAYADMGMEMTEALGNNTDEFRRVVIKASEIDTTGLSPDEISAEIQKWVDNTGAQIIGQIVPQFETAITAAGDRASELVQPLLAVANYMGGVWEPQIRQSFQEINSSTARTAMEIIAEHDGTVESTQRIAQAVTERGQIETAILQEIFQVQGNIDQMSGNLRERFQRAQETEQQYLDRLAGETQSAIAQLNMAEDASEVNALMSTITSNMGTAMGMASEEQKAAVAEQMGGMLDTADALAQARLDGFASQVEASHNQVAEAALAAIETGDGAAAQLAIAAEDSLIATQLMAEAALANSEMIGGLGAFATDMSAVSGELGEAGGLLANAANEIGESVAGGIGGVIDIVNAAQTGAANAAAQAARDQSQAATNTNTAAVSLNNAAGAIIAAANGLIGGAGAGVTNNNYYNYAAA